MCDNIAKNLKYDGYQRGFATMFFKSFDKNISGKGIKNKNMSDGELAEELHKPIITNCQKEKYNHLS